MLEKTKQNKKMMIEQLKKLPIIEAVCEKLSIGRTSFYRWKNSDEKFSLEVEDALLQGKHLINDLAEHQLISLIRDGELGAIALWLKSHHKDYKNKIEIEGQVKTDGKLTPEQEELIMKALTMASLIK
ncbi:MAG: hypothetical protein V1664_00235 [Candidatus Uhrbacteria bacterium]